MFCTNCGKEIKDDSRFCENCGTPVQAAPAEEAAPEIPEEPTVSIFNEIPAAAPVEEAAPEIPEEPTVSVFNEIPAAAEEKIPELTLESVEPVMPEIPEISGEPVMPEIPEVPEIPELEKTAPVAPDFASASAETQSQAQPYQPYQPQQAAPQAQAYQPYQPAPPQDGTTYQSPYQQPPKKKKTGLYIAIAAVLVVIAILASGIGGGTKGGFRSPEALYDAYFKAVAANDEKAMRNMIPDPWYEYIRPDYSSEYEFWQDVDYSHYFDVMGEKLDYYEVLGLQQKITDVAQYNAVIRGLNCDCIYQYKVDVYFKNGATEYFYFDLFEIDGKYWIMYVE